VLRGEVADEGFDEWVKGHGGPHSLLSCSFLKRPLEPVWSVNWSLTEESLVTAYCSSIINCLYHPFYIFYSVVLNFF